MKKLNYILLPIISLFTALSSSHALELIIEDASGNIRHASEVQGKANLRLSVTNLSGQPVEGAKITIELQDAEKNPALKKEDKLKHSKVVVGLAEFKDVIPGRWVISASSDNLLLANVDVFDPSAMMAQPSTDLAVTGGIKTGALVGGGLIVGGSAIAITSNSNTDGDFEQDDEPSPFS